MRDLTGSFAAGQYGLVLMGVISPLVCVVFLHIPDAVKQRSEALSAQAD